MDQTVYIPAPYFDPNALRDELAGYWKEAAGREGELRAHLLGALGALVEEARDQARRQLEADGDGRRCAEGLARFQDALIGAVYEFTVEHVYRAGAPSSAEHMTVVATGGYGRGLLAPGSDIDLLFLLPYKQTAWGESVAEYILYVLWDLGFKVGHATRTVEQCVRLSRSDMTIRTALLDARRILGDEDLFNEFRTRFVSDVVKGTSREFIAAKLRERDERHERSGASRYLVEPNVKDGKGGLRDLHTLYWLARYLYPDKEDARDFIKAGVFTRTEYNTFARCVEFLWSVRCNLHFLSGRAEERLSFDVQKPMAERLGYRDGRGLHAVERFMKHYFLVAKDVGDLTRVVCAALEVKQLKAVPALNEILAPQNWRRRNVLRRTTDFRIDNGRINVARADAFEQDPVNLIRLFTLGDRYNAMFHPEAIRLVRQSLRLIDKSLRENREANRLFLNLLTKSKSPENALRRMNETGVLGKFVPAFGRVVAMMQFNMYHHYTVDEHLIRAIGMLSDIEHGRYAEEHPLATEVIETIENRRVLYVALFLHDIAKGRKEDHSIAGARLARRLCPRLGLTRSETDTVAWLVEHHLAMSQFAQSRDLGDPKTIGDFAALVQSPERLKLLLVLTVADIRAVGPDVFNGWKGQLLRTLYYETQPILAGGHDSLSRTRRVDQAKAALRTALGDFSDEEFEAFAVRHEPAYWLKTNSVQQAAHARMIRRADAEGETFVTNVATDAFNHLTELTVYGPNLPRLLLSIAGACAAAGANIVNAQISTTRDGVALDTILLHRDFDRCEDEERRAKRIGTSIEGLIEGEISMDELLAGKRKAKERLRAFSVAPQVVIDNTLSDDQTVIEVNGLDRPGLLYDLTCEIADMKLDIASAHIATYGERAVDVFYVTDFLGKKITNAARQTAIRHRLHKVLQYRGEDDG